MSRLEPPINTMLRLSMVRRPSRSPMGPSTRLPTGRIKEPTARTPKAATTCIPGESVGKKALPRGVAT